MNQQMQLAPLENTNTIGFDEILNKASKNPNSNYEVNSKLLIANILDSIQKMAEDKEEPLIAINNIVDYLGDLISFLENAYGYKEDINNLRDKIKYMQEQLGLYLENDNKDLSKLLKAVFDLVDSNKKLINTSANANSSDIAKELLVTGGKDNSINKKQEELEKLLKVTINKELSNISSDFKSFDFGKLDKLYSKLYEAIIEDNAVEITNARGNLIKELKRHDGEIKELNTKLKPMIAIKEIMDSTDKTENRQSRIKEILEQEENKKYKDQFHDKLDNYKEFEKNFMKYYDLLDVKKVELYKDALKEELEEHGNFLKKRRNEELFNKKVGVKAFPNSIGLAVKIFANSIDKVKYNNYSRKNNRLLKEAVLDAFNVVAVPGACALKFAAENWYTIYLVTNGIIKQHDRQVEAQQAAERLENEARERTNAIMEYQKLHPELSLEEIEKIVDDYSKVSSYSSQAKMYQEEVVRLQEAEAAVKEQNAQKEAREQAELDAKNALAHDERLRAEAAREAAELAQERGKTMTDAEIQRQEQLRAREAAELAQERGKVRTEVEIQRQENNQEEPEVKVEPKPEELRSIFDQPKETDPLQLIMAKKEELITKMMLESHVPRSVAEKFFDDFMKNVSENSNFATAPKVTMRAATAEEIDAAREQQEQREQLKDGWVVLDGQWGGGISIPIPASWAGFFIDQGYVLKDGILWQPGNYELYGKQL